jgi:tRNA threonylcarbamoyladenosine dehydratase
VPEGRSMSDYLERFGGVARLYGVEAQARLRRAHVAVIGLGGVGSWACEALARSGVGALTLVDLDDVCVSNINRQLPALTGTLGHPKVEVLAGRAREIQPEITLHPVAGFFTEASADAVLSTSYDGVVDAIDRPSLKALLIASCRQRGLPVVTVGGAGGRRDPTQVRVTDLGHSTHDPLLAEVRRRLRRDHGFPRDHAPFGVECVCSAEPISSAPAPVPAEGAGAPPEDSTCAPASGSACGRRFGTACFVTGTFGFVAAARIVARVAGEDAGRGGSGSSGARRLSAARGASLNRTGPRASARFDARPAGEVEAG